MAIEHDNITQCFQQLNETKNRVIEAINQNRIIMVAIIILLKVDIFSNTTPPATVTATVTATVITSVSAANKNLNL